MTFTELEARAVENGIDVVCLLDDDTDLAVRNSFEGLEYALGGEVVARDEAALAFHTNDVI